MKKILQSIVCFFVVGLTLTGCGGSSEKVNKAPPPPPPSKPVLAGYTDIPALMDFYDVPGVSIAVINNYQVDQVHTFGVTNIETGEPVAEQTLFQAASMSKPVAAIGAMMMVEDGLMALDADINNYLTSWKVEDNEHTVTEKVTLRRLIGHSAGTTVHGFGGYSQSQSLPTLVEILNGDGNANSGAVVVDTIPGTVFRYSGGGFTVAQLAMENVSGQLFDQLLAELILQPLGMSSSTFSQPLPMPNSENASAGHYSNGDVIDGLYHNYPEMAAAGLWSTPTDMANFLTEIQMALLNQSDLLINQDTAELMMQRVLNSQTGLGFQFFGDNGDYFGHGGANEGFRSVMTAHMTDGVGVVIMTNSNNGHLLFNDIVDFIGVEEGWP